MATHPYAGFGPLRTPIDLLRKLEHDLGRLRDDPDNAFAAFDFFVTAYHILDWIHPNDAKARKDKEARSPLLQICSHLANGAKHFEATATKHTSVRDVMVAQRAFQSNAFQANAYQSGGLTVQLDGQAAVDFGARVKVIVLAEALLAHWTSDLRLKP